MHLIKQLVIFLFIVLSTPVFAQSFANDSIATSFIRKIYADRQQLQKTVDLSEIEAAIKKTNAKEYLIAKVVGQQIMNILDKRPYYQGLISEDYKPYVIEIHKQVEECKRNNFPSLTLVSLLVLGFVYEYGYEKDNVIANSEEAMAYYQQLPEATKKKVVTTNYLMASFCISLLQQKTSYYDYEGIQQWLDLGLYWSKKTYEEAEEKNKKNSVVFYSQALSMAGSYFGAMGKIDSAIDCWDRAIAESEKVGHDLMLLALLDKKSQFYLLQESYKEALEVHFKGLDLAIKIDDVTSEVAHLKGVAMCYDFMENQPKAKQFYYRLIAKLADKDKIQVGILPVLYLGVALFYEKEGKLDSAIYYQLKRKEVSTMLGEFDNLFAMNVELAMMYLEVGDTLRSNLCFKEATEVGVPELTNDRNWVLKLTGIAQYFDRVGNTKQMIYYAQEAFYKAEELNLIGERMKAAEYLVKGYLYQENKDSVTKYLEAFKTLQKDFFALTQDSALLDLQTKYETKEKEQEIEVLGVQNKLERQNRNMSIGLMFFALLIALAVIMLYFRQKKISKELQQLQNTKDKLFSIIAHDLRTPFNALMGFSKTLQENKTLQESEELKSSVRVIHEASKTAYFLFEDLLAWTKSQTGQLSSYPENLHLEVAIQESLNTLQGMLKYKQLNIILELEEKAIKADTYMFQTIIRNLVTNAIKFSNHHGAITIKSKAKGPWVCITIIDEGKGMEANVLSSLFADGGNSKGLGLVLCKDFVERHGGQIGAESTPDLGTSIWFTLPKGVAPHGVITNQANKLTATTTSFALSSQALEQLQPFIEKFKSLSVYYSTDLKQLVKELRQYNEPTLNQWLIELDKAIDESDAELYSNLMKQLKG